MINELERFQLEIEDVREDIASLNLNLPISKVCDIGFGDGYATLALAGTLNPSEIIGIDNNLRCVEKANDLLKRIKAQCNSSPESNNIRDAIQYILNNSILPEFLVGDIVEGLNLPSGFQFVYCKKVLINILRGSEGFKNTIIGDKGIDLAVRNIASMLGRGGTIVVIEPDGGLDFRKYFDDAGLVRSNSSTDFARFDIGSDGRIKALGVQPRYMKYVYVKA